MGKDFFSEAFNGELLETTPLSIRPRYEPDPEDHWNLQFKDFAKYDWQDPWFKKQNLKKYAFRVIELTKGYFMIVSPRDYKRMTQFPDGKKKCWHTKIDNDPEGNIIGVYARRHGRGLEPSVVYAHRELLNCFLLPGKVDHVNGYGLDNRMCNLHYVEEGNGENNTNSIRSRAEDLPQGVERRSKIKECFGGKVCVRLSKKKVVTIRSEESWGTPEPASQWYLKKLDEIYGSRLWAHNLTEENYPEFPRRLPSSIIEHAGEEVPF